MKQAKITKYSLNNVIIDGEPYRLCSCQSCGNVAAVITGTGLSDINLLECCKNPNYTCCSSIIDAFIEEWR